MNIDQWKPIRNGDIFCSPSCGGRCKHSEFLEANTKSEDLVSKMGEGWRAIVWENLGWHWKVAKGDVVIYPQSDNSYWCYFSGSKQYEGWGETPEEALEDMKKDAADFYIDVSNDYNHIKKF